MRSAESKRTGDAPAPERVRRARVFWQQSEHDLKDAWSHWKSQDYLTSSYLSFQAAINALMSVCYLHGHAQFPTFSTVQLAALCRQADERFGGIAEACAALEQVQERGPFDEGRALPEEMAHARTCYDHSAHVARTVRSYLKANRRRYFAP